jgi:hypothetical protein
MVGDFVGEVKVLEILPNTIQFAWQGGDYSTLMPG